MAIQGLLANIFTSTGTTSSTPKLAVAPKASNDITPAQISLITRICTDNNYPLADGITLLTIQEADYMIKCLNAKVAEERLTKPMSPNQQLRLIDMLELGWIKITGISEDTTFGEASQIIELFNDRYVAWRDNAPKAGALKYFQSLYRKVERVELTDAERDSLRYKLTASQISDMIDQYKISAEEVSFKDNANYFKNWANSQGTDHTRDRDRSKEQSGEVNEFDLLFASEFATYSKLAIATGVVPDETTFKVGKTLPDMKKMITSFGLLEADQYLSIIDETAPAVIPVTVLAPKATAAIKKSR